MLEESASAIPSSIWASINSWFTPTVLFILLNLMIATIAFTSTLSNQKQNQKNSQNDPHKPNIAKPPPSSLLHRLKSINFNRSQEPQSHTVHHKPNPADSNPLFNVDHTQNLETQSHYFFQENLETHTQTQADYVFEQAREPSPRENRARLDFDEKEPESDHFQLAREEKAAVAEESSEPSTEEAYGHLTTGGNVSRTKSDTKPASGELPAKLPARMRKSASMKSPFGHFEEEAIVETRRPATVREKTGNAKVTDGDEEVDAKADDFINRFKQQLKLQRLDSIIRYKDMIGRGSGGS